MINFAAVEGRLTRDVNVNYTNSGIAIAHFTLASDEDFKDRNGNTPADFVDCEMFGFKSRQTGQINNNRILSLSQYAHKGSLISITGKNRVEQNRKTGQYVQNIRVSDYTFLETRAQNGMQRQAPQNPMSNPQPRRISQPRRTQRPAPANPFAPAPKAKASTQPQQQAPVQPAPTGQQIAKANQSGKKIDISDDDLPF